jgi:hypothetical protein
MLLLGGDEMLEVAFVLYLTVSGNIAFGSQKSKCNSRYHV